MRAKVGRPITQLSQSPDDKSTGLNQEAQSSRSRRLALNPGPSPVYEYVVHEYRVHEYVEGEGPGDMAVNLARKLRDAKLI